MSQEQRQHPRKKERLLIQLHGKDFQIYTNATDIGVGGAFVNTLYLLAEGTPLELKIALPNSSKTIDISGKVIRQVADTNLEPNMDHIGMAVVFNELSPESSRVIENLITS